jgi:prolipoprotein diacylglyceryltransferase
VESLADLALCAALLVLWSRRLRPGVVLATYLVGYGLLRIVAETFRGDAVALGPAPLGVWWGAAIALAGAAGLVRLSPAIRGTDT